MRVKICGVNSHSAYEAAAQAHADWVGFVFFDRSPRCVTPAGAARLARSGGPAKIGLFVNPTDDELSRALDAVPLDAVQLYVSATRFDEVAARFAVPLWRAVGVTTADDLPAEAGSAAAFVVEPRPPEGASRPGGLARRLDWRVLAGWTPPAPWLLAGGLTPLNVARAVAETGAVAVDVSSGVETEVGVKAAELIAAFVAAARSAGPVEACEVPRHVRR